MTGPDDDLPSAIIWGIVAVCVVSLLVIAGLVALAAVGSAAAP